MPSAIEILAHTPTYVWFLLAWLVWQGFQSLKPKSQPVWRLLVVPVVFGLWGLWPLFGGPFAGMPAVLVWLAAFLVFLPLGFLTGPKLLAKQPDGTLLRTASVVPLVRNIGLFFLHYALAATMAVRPDMQDTLLLAGFALSGLSIGYFSGWSLCLWRQMHAPKGTVERA